ncbi:N4 gp69-like protein [Roseovarius Plymouth podovirus 1]|uniref:N4 gp69-like protein n=2 Tax=Roseovarius Plymouth podovirus 1 TaxID=926474 RepID=K4Q4V4_9CAUD|nr:N4 gp69-like protein [Roseovarius Plymouth podovirus 1]CBW47073.1 N4 gp69-like protein [Roseovarius sp. 217 phage 1]CBX88009.1 N4 gp69-like protein [Roseovarius Plymouth podovirus 1]
MLTLQQVQDSLPAGQKGHISQEMVNQLNALSKDPEEARYIRENFITFSQVLSEGRFKLGDYVRAVMYVSHKVMGKSNLDSYKATFPDRYKQMVADGRSGKDIASYVAAYNKGKLVNMVYERAMIPTWVLNQDMFQSALNTQYEIMNNVQVSDKVRVEAANSLLTHLKKPEVNKAELKVDIGMNDGMKALEQRLGEMANMQLKTIEGKAMSVEDVAALPLNVPDAEIVDE